MRGGIGLAPPASIPNRASTFAPPVALTAVPPCHPVTGCTRIAWAKMIRKVCEVDPLTCPECGAQMRVISLIEDPAVIERILCWLGPWDPRPACGPSPPGERASLPLAYHPVPDIA